MNSCFQNFVSIARSNFLRSRLIGIFLAGLLIVISTLAQPPARKKNQPEPPPAKEQNSSQDDQVLSVATTQIVVNATILDSQDRFVSGLKAGNFKIFEDHIQQKIVSFGFEETPFSAAILLDTSGSMTYKMSLARAACSRFAAGIREGDTVAIYKFGGLKVKLLQDFTEVRDVDPIIWETDADGETPLYDAIVTASEALGQRPENRRAILLLSDGADTRSKASFEQAIRAANAANVTIYAVDLSDSAFGQGPARDNGAKILKEFALKTGGRFFQTPGGGKLRDAFEETVNELRHQYTIVYEPTNEKQDGKWRAIELNVSNPQLKVRTRQGYYAARPEKEAGKGKTENNVKQ